MAMYVSEKIECIRLRGLLRLSFDTVTGEWSERLKLRAAYKYVYKNLKYERSFFIFVLIWSRKPTLY